MRKVSWHSSAWDEYLSLQDNRKLLKK